MLTHTRIAPGRTERIFFSRRRATSCCFSFHLFIFDTKRFFAYFAQITIYCFTNCFTLALSINVG